MATGRVALACAAALHCIASLADPPAHPLDPLSLSEIRLATRLIQADSRYPHDALFHSISLREPPKADVLAFSGGQAILREAVALVTDSSTNTTFEAQVDLNAKKVIHFDPRPGFQPPFIFEEMELLGKIAQADPGWRSALSLRGISRPEDVWLDGWAPGESAPKELRDHRLMHAVAYLKKKDDNYYGRPIEGLTALVDLTTRKVIQIHDSGVIAIADRSQQFDAKSLGPTRSDVKPLVVGSPRGPSFTVRGHEVQWQHWRFRFGVQPREGLVLYRVAYEDGGRLRDILYRASLSEMVVPYGDADPNWSWRSAFDADQYGIGSSMVELKPGQDVPQNAVFFSAAYGDGLAKPYERQRVVALYERYGGTLWKHGADARPARDLVICASSEVGNYDYGMAWVFHQDGSLDLDMTLTGVMLPKGVTAHSLDEGHGGGHLVAPGLVAPHHQHFMNFRLDFDIDGTANTVAEMNVAPVPGGEANPLGNRMEMSERPLESEVQARRELDFASARRWKVVNPAVKNDLGYPSGYILIPGDNSVPYLSKQARAFRGAGFLSHHLWVSRFKQDEMHASGEFPGSANTGDGLERWTSDDEPLTQTDLVLWYTLGVTHLPRPEEWPVMSVTHAGFRLVPAGFFSRNPALDVPP